MVGGKQSAVSKDVMDAVSLMRRRIERLDNELASSDASRAIKERVCRDLHVATRAVQNIQSLGKELAFDEVLRLLTEGCVWFGRAESRFEEYKRFSG